MDSKQLTSKIDKSTTVTQSSKIYFTFDTTVQPQQFIIDIFKDNSIVASHKQSKIAKNYYEVSTKISYQNKRTIPLHFEVWETGLSICINSDTEYKHLTQILQQINNHTPIHTKTNITF